MHPVLSRRSWLQCVALPAALPLFSRHPSARAADAATSGSARTSPAPRPRLGINLAGPADWNTELPFVDAFRLARAWISQQEGAGWGRGPALDLDADGWVRRLAPGCFAETPLCTIEGGHYPSGRWTVLWDGQGRIELSKGRVVASAPGRLEVDLDAAGGGFFLRLRETDPARSVRRIRVLRPGVSLADAEACPWEAGFLERWRGVACLRFMDFQLTNDSTQREWTERARPDDATYTLRGIPVELLCDLANRLRADAWFCLPHLASDDYIRSMAAAVKRHLDPALKAYVEYSNEVWNGQFRQHAHAAEAGRQLGLAEKTWEAAWRFTAHRSLQIFTLWEAEFGNRDRLVRVLASQAANPGVARQILGWKDAARHADVLAIAPYLSMNIPPTGERGAERLAGWTADQFLDHVEAQALPECLRWMADHQTVAREHGLRLVAYEAGQHFVGIQGAENNDRLTRLLHDVNRHPRMGTLYDRYYAGWEERGGDLLCHFSSVGQWSKWGSWGLLEHADEDPRTSPKFMATVRWASRRGQPIRVP